MREYFEEKKLLTNDVDFNKRLKGSAILDIFQEIAARGADLLNAGYTKMQENNMFWVLSRLKYKVTQYPKYLDKIVSRTWPKRTSAVHFERDYQILKDNEVVISASSVWCVLDKNTHRILPAKTLNLFDIDFIEENAIDEKLGKITPCGDTIKKYTRQVMPCDLDFNMHMNNIRYSDFIIDGFNDELLSQSICEFQINYEREVKLWQRVDMEYRKNQNELYVTGNADSVECFACKIVFK